MSGFLWKTVADLRDEDIPKIINAAWERVQARFPEHTPKARRPLRVQRSEYPAILEQLRAGATYEALGKAHGVNARYMRRIGYDAGFSAVEMRATAKLRKEAKRS